MSGDQTFPPRPLGGIGPGSQPDAGEDFAFMPMPKGMFRHEMALSALPEPEEAADLPRAMALLARLREAAAACAEGGAPARIGMDDLDARERAFIAQLMGVGEVSIRIDPAPVAMGDRSEDRGLLRIQESVMTGVWQVRHEDRDGTLLAEWLEVGPIPAAVLDAQPVARRLAVPRPPLPEGVMSAPALLAEIADRLDRRAAGAPDRHVGMQAAGLWAEDPLAHEINLTLLPVSDADLVMLGETLGVGPVTILSRGYGNCRIGMTACRDVWWLKFYNSQDALILNTIRIVTVPEVALAAPEDLADTARRLAEVADLYGV